MPMPSTCPNCRTTNVEGAKFCFNCGTRLPQLCAHCATPLAEGARFCFNCGNPVAQATPAASAPEPAAAATAPVSTPDTLASAQPKSGLQNYMTGSLLEKLEAARAGRSMAGERRIVTILFCDVKGSTSMAEMLDPEEWAGIMNRAFEYLISPVYKYEGTLARLMGDAILAFFGAPIAHEDDPQRAILAGLEIAEGIKPFREQIKREYGLDFNVRVGINTGLVVVGEVGSDLRMEYTAMGDVVNVASRMEQTAEPGTVQVAENTYKSVANLFDFEPLGEIDLKGKTEPIVTYRVIRAREGAVPTRGIEGLSSPMVGRDRDLGALQSKVQELLEGRGQIVSVTGEAGLGKSRLVTELRKSANTSTVGPVRWYEGRSLSYEINTPYAPFIALLEQLFGLKAEDGGEDKYAKIESFVRQIAPGHEDGITPFMGALLEAALPAAANERVRYLEPPQLRGRIFGAAQGLFEAVAAFGPTILVFDDLHWADPTSLDLLEQIMPITGHAPLMLLAIFRPQRQEPSWRFHEAAARDYPHSYTQVAIEPLDEQSSRLLVANLLEIEDLPEKVRLLILQKSEGNPFFVEEVIRSLLDNKLVVREGGHWRATREIENIQVPDTLAGVITARLDRLDKGSKVVAQTASVIGREFAYDILDTVCDEPEGLVPAMADLQRRELVREKSRVPMRAYLFKHVLTQETAYASILLSKRRDLHRRVAEGLEQTEPDRVNEIGRHFLEARESARALPYLVQAGERAAKTYASKEAITFFTQALDALQRSNDPTMAKHIYEGLGGVQMYTGNIMEAIGTFQQMLSYAEAHSDGPMKVSALNKLARVAMFTGDMAQMEKNLNTSEEIAHEQDDVPGLVEMYTVRCAACNLAGDFDAAARYLGDSLSVCRTLNIGTQTAWSLAHTANTLTYMTRFEEAKERAEEAVQVAESIGDQAHLGEALSYALPMYFMAHKGDLDAARQSLKRGLGIANATGVPFVQGLASFGLGMIAQVVGEYERAIEFNHKALEGFTASGYGFANAYPLCQLGSIYLEISPELIEKTREFHSQAVQVLSGPSGNYAGAVADVHLGFCAMAQGALDKAAEYFQTGISTPTPEWLIMRPRLLAGLGLVRLAEGKLEEAEQKTEGARAYASERGIVDVRPAIEAASAQICLAKGDTEVALAHFANAEKYATQMGMKPLVWQAQAGQAEALARMGRNDEADTKRREAEQVVDQIASEFKDEQLKSLYLENSRSKIKSGEEFLI